MAALNQDTICHSNWIIKSQLGNCYGSFTDKKSAEIYAQALRDRRGLQCKVVSNFIFLIKGDASLKLVSIQKE